MSTDWGFWCPTHDEWSGYNINHGQNVLRSMWHLREPIAAIIAANDGDIEVTSLYGTEVLAFLAAHKDCPLELRSEYGDTEPVAGSPCQATAIVDGLYRYDLTRRWQDGDDWAVWVMLNPSTADANLDDPTIRRCIGFTRREGLGGLAVVNRFALRTTKPAHLLHHPDPVGPDNARHVEEWISRADIVIAAWGAAFHKVPGTDRWDPDYIPWLCRKAGVPLMCLGTTKDGHPRHPLYVKGDQALERWPR